MLKRYMLLGVAAIFALMTMAQLGSGVRIMTKAWLSHFLIDQAWSRTLAGEEKVRPWPWADTWPVAELKVPRIDFQQVVLSGDSGEVLAFGPGMNHYIDEGLDLDFTIVSGHRDTHFSFLEDIRVNDTFELKGLDGQSRWYQIFETKIVDENWSFPDVTGELEHLMILATCYPFNSIMAGSDKRLLVFAMPLEKA